MGNTVVDMGTMLMADTGIIQHTDMILTDMKHMVIINAINQDNCKVKKLVHVQKNIV